VNIADLQLGDVVNIVVQPTSSTSRSLRASGATSVATVIGIDPDSTRLAILLGWKEGEKPLRVGMVGQPPGPKYMTGHGLYAHQLWVDTADIVSKVGATVPTVVMGATCSCGFQNPCWDKTNKYVCQSCKMWAHVSK
jgi:hypothetical protein